MKEERVIVYIDENTDDGMMWEELNQKGQMQISVYDEEFESWSEYQHSIVVKSLQEHLTDYTKQVRKEVVQEIKEKLKPKEIFHPEDEFTLDYDFYYKEDVEEILDQIQGETNG